MNFGNKILKYQDDMMRDLAELVAIPSVRGEAAEGQPFGKECADALNCILNMANRMGLTTKNVGNYAGHAEYGEGDEVAAVVTHVDVVPAGEGWETDPFTLTRKGNLYFGRGTADDKGAAIVALYCLKVLKEENVPAKRRLRAIFGAGEETGSDDLERYLESEQLPAMAFTPDSDYGICNREKGILRFEVSNTKNDSTVISEFVSGTVVNAVPSKAICTIRCSDEQYADLQRASSEAEGDFHFEKTGDGARITSIGKASHAMQPQEGFNAATHLIKLLTQVFSPDELGSLVRFVGERIGTELDGRTLGIRQEDQHSGPLTLNLGLFHIGADFARAGFDVRYPVTSDGEPIFSTVSAQAAEYGLDATLNADTKPLFLPESSPFITLLQDSYAAVTGKQAELYATGGGTYARAFKGNAVAFGLLFPEEPDRRLHNTGEHIDIEYFMLHAQVCLEAMYRMLTA
jgi:succinyl-diaminopimelate desuccinylase